MRTRLTFITTLTTLLVACLVSFAPAPASAQPKCKAPKQFYQGKCRYPDEIDKMKRAAQPKPQPRPQPQPAPEPVDPRPENPEVTPEPEPMDVPEPPPAVAPDPAPEPSVVPAPVPPPTPPNAPQPDGGDTGVDDTGGLGGQQIGALVVGGLGIAGLAIGAVLAVTANSSYDESIDDGHCDANNMCSTKGLELRDSAFAKATGADVAFIAGGVLLAGGVVLWLTAPDDEPESTTGLNVSIRLAGRTGLMAVHGTW